MTVIPLTLVISLCLTITFIVFFMREHGRRRFTSPEHDSLLPLADEKPVCATRLASDGPVVLELGGRRGKRRHEHRKDEDHTCSGRCGTCDHHHD